MIVKKTHPTPYLNVVLTLPDGTKKIAYWDGFAWFDVESEGLVKYPYTDDCMWLDIPNLNGRGHVALRTMILFFAKGVVECMELFNSDDLWVSFNDSWDVNVFKTEQGFEADAFFVLEGVRDFNNIYNLGVVKF